jgi:hypothetical protein
MGFDLERLDFGVLTRTEQHSLAGNAMQVRAVAVALLCALKYL